MVFQELNTEMDKLNLDLDLDLVPDFLEKRIALDALAFVRRIISTPEGKKALEQKKAELGLS